MTGLRSLCVVIPVVTPSLAVAAAAAPSMSVRTACAPDAKRLCGPVIHDREARHKCMVAHHAQLSDACKAALAEDSKAPSPTAGDAQPAETTAPPAPPGADPPETK